MSNIEIFLKIEILGADSSYSKTIEHTGSNPELGKAITLSLKNVGNSRYQYGE